MSRIVSPDCRDQNHQKCPGDAWDEAHDHATECQCACHVNGGYPALQAAHAAYKKHLNTGELTTLEGALAAALTAAAPIMRAEVLRDVKALTQVAVDMAAASTSPAHHVIRAIFSVSKLEDQAKAEAWDEGATAAWERSTPTVNGMHYNWRSNGEPCNPYRDATLEGKSE